MVRFRKELQANLSFPFIIIYPASSSGGPETAPNGPRLAGGRKCSIWIRTLIETALNGALKAILRNESTQHWRRLLAWTVLLNIEYSQISFKICPISCIFCMVLLMAWHAGFLLGRRFTMNFALAVTWSHVKWSEFQFCNDVSVHNKPHIRSWRPGPNKSFIWSW